MESESQNLSCALTSKGILKDMILLVLLLQMAFQELQSLIIAINRINDIKDSCGNAYNLVKSVVKERLPDAWAVKRLYVTSTARCY